MTPAHLIRDARSGGVLLSLTPTGTLKATGNETAIRHWGGLIHLHREAIIATLRHDLGRFQLDMVEEAIAAGHPVQELHRVNNMAWEFMRADGMSFDEAIRVAAAIVTTCPPAPCDASYVDIWTLWTASARN